MDNKVNDQMLAYNKRFVESKAYENYRTDKYPDKKTAIISCMDTRLTTLLPAALGLKNGDVKMIKFAGAVITDPFDNAIRSLLVAIYELGVNNVMVITHTHCGAHNMSGDAMLAEMRARGISQETIDTLLDSGIDLKGWLTGFDDTAKAVNDTVRLIRRHPLIPSGIEVNGFVIDTETGELRPVNNQ